MKILTRMLILSTTIFCLQCSNKEQPVNEQDEFLFMEYSIDQLHQGYKNQSYSIVDVVGAYLDRIEAIDIHGPALNSMISINPDALEIAQSLDNELEEGKIRGSLHGIPVVLKDNIDTNDKMPTTAGSRALKDSYPLKDSYVAKKLREAGAVIIGKANLSEWANFRGQLSTRDRKSTRLNSSHYS